MVEVIMIIGTNKSGKYYPPGSKLEFPKEVADVLLAKGYAKLAPKPKSKKSAEEPAEK